MVDHAPLKGDIAYVLGSRWAQPEEARALIDEHTRIDEDARRETARVRAAICTSLKRVLDGADEGNRTPVFSLGS
jgi:hypothetical protein